MRETTGVADVNNTQLYYDIHGAGEVVVLVHGFSLDQRMWDAQIDALAEHFQVLRYDLRGFGQSADVEPGAPYTHEDDLAALLDALEIARVAVVGLSLGGGVAIDFAVHYPDRTTALVVADGAMTGYDWPNGKPSLGPAASAQADGVEAGKKTWLGSPLFEPASSQPAVIQALHQIVADYSGWHWFNENPLTIPSPTAAERLGDINCPTLVMVGEHDVPDFHAIADLLEQQIPNIVRHQIDAAGHMSNMENPEAFNRVLVGFLRRAVG